MLNYILIYSSDGNFVRQSHAISVILVEGIVFGPVVQEKMLFKECELKSSEINQQRQDDVQALYDV